MGPYRSDIETAHAKIARLEATVQRLTDERARRDRAAAPTAGPSNSWRWIAFVAASCVAVIGLSLSPHDPPLRVRGRVDANETAPLVAPPSTIAPGTAAPSTAAPSTIAPSPAAPSTIAPSPATPRSQPRVHATEHGALDNLRLDERALVWRGDDTIRILDLASNEVRTLASDVHIAGAMAMNETHVYWAGWRAGSVMRVARDGGAPEVVAEIGERLPTGMALTSTHVYWTEFIGAVYRLPLDGGEVENLGWETPAVATSPEIRGDYLYLLATRGEVRRRRVGPDPAIARTSVWETITILEDDDLLTDIAVDDTHVYGLSTNGSFVFRAPLEGGSAEMLTRARQYLGLAVADDWLYMTTASGVVRMPRAGGPLETIAPGYTRAITVGGGRVYWASEGPSDSDLESMPVPHVLREDG